MTNTPIMGAGVSVIFAGTFFAYLHVCGTPWDGNEYNEGDKAVWTMSTRSRGHDGSPLANLNGPLLRWRVRHGVHLFSVR